MVMPEKQGTPDPHGDGVLLIRGADAVKFLQGQLSNDVERLAAGTSMLAGYHTPQGRVIAVLRLQRRADDVVAELPRGLVPVVAARLSKFILRSKVTITDATAEWSARGLLAEPSPEATLRSIEAGLPQVYPATSEAFVAQMLNLDLTGGIAFDKGCYTGQEIIARAHYRGRVKRRMQRFVTREPATLAPGDQGTLPDGRSFRVVEAALRADGRCEFLAVAPLGAGADADAVVDDTPAAGHPPLAVEQLPLPYALPVEH